MPQARILVIDDEPHIREIVRLKLQSAGYDVATAESGPLGLEAAKNAPPGLIITDYNMPGGINGLELVKAIRRTEAIMQTPVIMLTGSVAVAGRIEDEIAGTPNVVLMQKPFSPRDLLKTVERVLADGVREGEQSE
jgi:DNA-binding response OmpR family regulator